MYLRLFITLSVSHLGPFFSIVSAPIMCIIRWYGTLQLLLNNKFLRESTQTVSTVIVTWRQIDQNEWLPRVPEKGVRTLQPSSVMVKKNLLLLPFFPLFNLHRVTNVQCRLLRPSSKAIDFVKPQTESNDTLRGTSATRWISGRVLQKRTAHLGVLWGFSAVKRRGKRTFSGVGEEWNPWKTKKVSASL